jgi:hypothetical protein
MILTKNYYTAPLISHGGPMLTDIGYSIPIPANDIYSTGWQDVKPDIPGFENKLIIRKDGGDVRAPEFFTENNILRSNVLPIINPDDPRYAYSMLEHVVSVF